MSDPINKYIQAKTRVSLASTPVYSLALVWAFFRTGSIFVAFMILPLIFSLPPMNRRWALALPATREPKSASESWRVTLHHHISASPIPSRGISPGDKEGNIPSALPPSGAAPLPTSPLFFRSRYQLSSLPSLFLTVKAMIALVFSMASLRSAASAWRTPLMASKAAEEGKASVRGQRCRGAVGWS